jgi:hypothetical protein
MAVVLEWLSRRLHRTGYEKNYEPLESQCPSLESGLQEDSTAAEFTTACQRLHYARDLINTKYGALCYQQMLSESRGEQDAALQELINQYETLLRAILRHTVAMGLAAKRGRDLSVDAKFWREHEQLLQQLPEEMRPKWDNVGMKPSKESVTSLRKRDHVQIPIASY